MPHYSRPTITIVGNDVPIILGIEPVKERSAWEPEDAPADSKADVVDRLLETVQQYVALDEVLLDRGFYSNEVYATIHDRGLVYMTPVPKYEDDYESIAKIKSKDGVNAAVKHDVPFAIDGELHHTAEFLYVPATNEKADGNYAVFVTNRDHVALNEIMHVANSYSRRWDIENQYKSVKAFLPKTSSKDYRVRLFTFTFAALLYNLWRLTDYLVKVGMGRDIRPPPSQPPGRSFGRSDDIFARAAEAAVTFCRPLVESRSTRTLRWILRSESSFTAYHRSSVNYTSRFRYKCLNSG